MHTKWSVCEWVSECVSEWGPQSSWRPLAVGSTPNMTELSLLTQGDWAEGATAHNGGTMAAPLVLMGDTCNRIRVRTPGGRPHGEMVHPHPSPLTTPHPNNPSLSYPTPSNLHKPTSHMQNGLCLTLMFDIFQHLSVNRKLCHHTQIHLIIILLKSLKVTPNKSLWWMMLNIMYLTNSHWGRRDK